MKMMVIWGVYVSDVICVCVCLCVFVYVIDILIGARDVSVVDSLIYAVKGVCGLSIVCGYNILTRQNMFLIDRAEVLLRKLANNVYNRLLSSWNSIAKEIVHSVFFTTSNRFKRWQHILF